MNVVPPASIDRSWPWHRWLFFIGLAYGAHIGFIFAFGDHDPVVPRAIVNVPTLRLTALRSQQQELDDPTLFALPHPNGFAGAAWLRRAPVDFAPFHWAEPPYLLALSGAQPGAAFQLHRKTNRFGQLELEPLPLPAVTKPNPDDSRFVSNQRSRVILGGELATRQWMNAPEVLPSWPSADLLTNSVVQVWIEADGQVISSALLPLGSGSKEADQSALKLAFAARFAPLSGAAAQPARGTLIFEWHTVPQTNATPVTP